MPARRDHNFADLLLDVAMVIDGICERLHNAQDERATPLIEALRDAELEINNVREQVQA